MVQRIFARTFVQRILRQKCPKSASVRGDLIHARNGYAEERERKAVLRRADDLDARQVTAASDELDLELQADAGLALDQGLWAGTRGCTRPGGTRLQARCAARRSV